MRTQPKKNLTLPNGYKQRYGNMVRKSYQNVILEKEPIFPKPLGYDDIDNSVFEFVDNTIDIAIDGKLIPTYTLYSNQRFSEYTQMWEHSDENGNLYLNFKTVNREKNPSFGDNQGKKWNIPGQRKYTLLQRQVLDDNGTESYEIYTMKQPYAVDLTYHISFVTTTVDYLNKFNQKINKFFESRQYYIRPNGHYLPMIIEDISDETSYSISDRKFYVQTITVKVMAYIIDEEDFEVKKYPRRINQILEGENFRKNKPCVEIEEDINNLENKNLTVNVIFPCYHSKVEFVFDTEMIVEKIETDNVRNTRIMVNDDLYYIDKPFNLKPNDEIRIKIIPFDTEKESVVHLIGYEKDSLYKVDEITENVSQETITHEHINVD